MINRDTYPFIVTNWILIGVRYLTNFVLILQKMLHMCINCFLTDFMLQICSDSQAALKSLQAIRTMSLLVQQCQKALNDITTLHAVRPYWVLGHAGVTGNEIADGLARGGSASRFVGPEQALGVSWQDIRRRISCWLVNQHWGWWRSLGSTQRLARELISGPCLGTKARFLSFNGTQSTVVTGLLTGHSTLRRYLYLMGLSDSPLCWRCGAEDETLAHILCEHEVLASIRHAHLGSFFLEPEYIKNVSHGVIWNFGKEKGLQRI
jgi:hypothetical protein